jgi:hypothetical protein
MAEPNIADELTKLAALRDQGTLTEAEFTAQKARLLGSSSTPAVVADPPPDDDMGVAKARAGIATFISAVRKYPSSGSPMWVTPANVAPLLDELSNFLAGDWPTRTFLSQFKNISEMEELRSAAVRLVLLYLDLVSRSGALGKAIMEFMSAAATEGVKERQSLIDQLRKATQHHR